MRIISAVVASNANVDLREFAHALSQRNPAIRITKANRKSLHVESAPFRPANPNRSSKQSSRSTSKTSKRGSAPASFKSALLPPIRARCRRHPDQEV